MEKVSVIMSTYKEPIEWVVKSIDSVINQSLPPYEFIIIVDDPSNNKLIDCLNKLASQYSQMFIVINEQNVGLVASLNRALTYCHGDYIARIDADDYAFSDRLQKQLNYMNDKQLDIVGAGYNIFFENELIEQRYGKDNDKLCKKLLKYTNCVAHPTWFVKKEVYDCLEGYRNIDACEDLDFLIRAALMGYKIGCVKEPLMWYRDNPKSISHEKNNKQQVLSAFLCKNYRKKHLVTIEEYEKYIHSQEYSKKVSAMIKTQLNTEKVIHSDGIYRVLNTIKVYLNKEYLIKKITNQKIKYINRRYG